MTTILHIDSGVFGANSKSNGLSAAFLEAIQATTLANIEAAAESDGPLARRGAAADAAFRVWVGAYTMGLLDPRDDSELPAYE